jgi:hypothetical protein
MMLDGHHETRAPLYFEDWGATYGSPYLIDDEHVDGAAELAEPSERLALDPTPGDDRPTAFIDGVRRGEGVLYQRDGQGLLIRGLAGAHGCGAALWRPGEGVTFGPLRTRRMVIFGGGLHVELEPIDGHVWESVSIQSTDPDAPLSELQTRMRESEGRLAESLAADGWLAVVDGPLNFVRSRDLPVIGYVKTHHRALLPAGLHARVPELWAGQRTPLFALGRDRYSSYLRVAAPSEHSSPWYGIVRIEVPQSFGLQQARQSADEAARMLPRFAGIPHRDPRAPQNLQPTGMLERQLRRRLGQPRLAARAVRRAVAASAREEAA